MLLRHDRNKTYERFNGRLAVMAPPVVKRLLEISENFDLSDMEFENMAQRMLMVDQETGNYQGAPVLPPPGSSGLSSNPPPGSSSSGKPSPNYILKNVKPINIPPHWHPWPNAYAVFDIFFGLVKILILVLKFFMICVRPLNLKYRKSRWAMWFGSTLTSFQIALTMGMVPGNFGGFVESMHSAAFTAFRQYFWLDPTHLWS